MSDGLKKLSQGHEIFSTVGLIDKLMCSTARTETVTTCFNLQNVSSDKSRLHQGVFTSHGSISLLINLLHRK